MKLDSGANLGQHSLAGGCSSHTPRQVRQIGRKAGASWFNHDGVGVGHRRRTPDCFSILRRVPGASSSLAFSATVTLPDRNGCLNWRWLPRVATKNQPAISSRLITTPTFTAAVPSVQTRYRRCDGSSRWEGGSRSVLSSVRYVRKGKSVYKRSSPSLPQGVRPGMMNWTSDLPMKPSNLRAISLPRAIAASLKAPYAG